MVGWHGILVSHVVFEPCEQLGEFPNKVYHDVNYICCVQGVFCVQH